MSLAVVRLNEMISEMKIRKGRSYFIDVRVVGRRRYYSYSADVIFADKESAAACEESELFGKPAHRIEISRKAWVLAALRVYPNSNSEVEKIISFSKGENISLSFFEKVILALAKS